MSQFTICKTNSLEEDECRVVAEDLLDQLVEKFGGSYDADGSNFRYKHSTGINAKVEPAAGELNIKVKMGLMTRAMAPKLEKEINRVLDSKLE